MESPLLLAFPQFPHTPTLSLLTFASLHSILLIQSSFQKVSFWFLWLSFSKVCFSFEMFKDNSVFLSCIPLDILYLTRHRWCLLEFVCHAAFLEHQKSKAKQTLVSKWGVSTVVWLLELRGESKGTWSSSHISHGVCLGPQFQCWNFYFKSCFWVHMANLDPQVVSKSPLDVHCSFLSCSWARWIEKLLPYHVVILDLIHAHIVDLWCFKLMPPIFLPSVILSNVYEY